MDYETKKQQLLKESEVLDALRDAGLLESVAHISEGGIWMKDGVNVDETRRRINRAFGCSSDRLSRYYVGHGGEHLAIEYCNDAVSTTYYVSDIEGALKRLSGGKCKLVETVKPAETKKEVVCDLEEVDA